MKGFAHHFDLPEENRSAGQWRRTVFSNPLMTLAALTVVLVVGMAVFGPWCCPHDPLATDIGMRLAPPSWHYPFGNDALGRCLFSRILVGARASLGLGVSVVLLSVVMGVAVGLVAGYAGGLVDELLMRLTDIFFAFPEIVAAMAIAGLMGPGTVNLLLSLSVASWMRYARVVRGITLSVREREYVRAAWLSGVRPATILWRHVLPASMPSIIVLATIGLGKSVLAVSALGFLGFGVQPPDAEWGMLLMEGKDYILSSPHLSVFPGVAIMVTVLAFNILGDGFRNRWDSRT
ncbi:nickel transporter permease [Desulfosarcina ovata]|uniref:Glutathione ABC transporter permease GsiD n=1 Tax=Desulfosarcina ovata subsp. ovata TaxID=2752305 RepID=A0A5K8AAA7_9BACT|nr:nickel transporter permease [Desulfosarcina ovata]BBO89517.1 glutathione ABC transporter permease GsiD [Desulfosarcina ovata subsp. ovata]